MDEGGFNDVVEVTVLRNSDMAVLQELRSRLDNPSLIAEMRHWWFYEWQLGGQTAAFRKELLWLEQSPRECAPLLQMPLWLDLFKSMWFSAEHITHYNERLFTDIDDLKKSSALASQQLRDLVLHHMNEGLPFFFTTLF